MNRLIDVSRTKIDKKTSRKLDMDFSIKKKEALENSNWENKFIVEKVQRTLKHIQFDKVARLDEIYPKFIKYSGPRTMK